MSWVLLAVLHISLLTLTLADTKALAQCEAASGFPTRLLQQASPVLFQKSRITHLLSDESAVTSDEDQQSGLGSIGASSVARQLVRDAMEAFHNIRGRLKMLANPETRQFKFGKVSVTVMCTMWLAVMMLGVYTVLAILRNSVELTESRKPPMSAEALEVAVRAAPHASMLCVLFVGCRMYVLASTDGKGDPPTWVRACMVLATLGLSIQVFLATLLPALVVDRENLSLSDLAGDHSTGHIRLPIKDFRGSQQWYVAFLLQAMAVFGIYGGSAGVVGGIFTFGDPSKVSPAVVSVVLLAVVFLLNQAHVALAAAYSTSGVAPPGVRAASARARKAPMVGVFFLAVRMRNLQMYPPDGMPPRWVWMSYYVVVAALILEVLASVCCPGSTAPKKSDDENPYSNKRIDRDTTFDDIVEALECHHYSPRRWVRYVQQVAFFVVFIAVGNIYISVMTSIDKRELSAEMKAVLRLTCLFFGVHMLQWVASFFSSGKLGDLIQGTALSAGVCVSLSPLLSALFVACRMRALQLTGQSGSPQWWAQESFHLGVTAIMIQVCCCVMLPIFTGAATSVDGDGNAEYDLRPLFGAYAVQVLKYIALFCLYGSVMAVCVAIFLMDESLVDEKVSASSASMLKHVLVALIACTLAGILSSAKVVGFVVKWTIEGLDERFLGVNIWVGKAALSLCRGYIFVNNLVVDNPPAEHFTSPALLKVGKVVVKLNVLRLVATRGQEIEITTLVLTNVEVNYEKDLFHGSNVGAILKFLQGEKSSQETVPPVPVAQPAASVTKAPILKRTPDADNSQQPEVELGLLLVKDISANVWTTQTGKLLSINLGDIEERDFQEHYQGKKHVIVQDVCAEVLKTILNTVMSNSHRLTHHAAEVVEAVVERNYRRVEGGLRRLCMWLPCGGNESHRRQFSSSASNAETVLRRAR